MSTTLEALERRVAALEGELAVLRRRLDSIPQAGESPVERGFRMMREARASQPAISAAVEEVYRALGITGEPVSPEEVQRMMIAEGIRPEDNAFSREIKAMREE
jgi:hypothetical protein